METFATVITGMIFDDVAEEALAESEMHEMVVDDLLSDWHAAGKASSTIDDDAFWGAQVAEYEAMMDSAEHPSWGTDPDMEF
jgi:hypothetical protein